MTIAIIPAGVPSAATAQDPFGTVDIVLEEIGITDKSRLDTFWIKQDRILKSPQQNYCVIVVTELSCEINALSKCCPLILILEFPDKRYSLSSMS
jgi:hypothetical protein